MGNPGIGTPGLPGSPGLQGPPGPPGRVVTAKGVDITGPPGYPVCIALSRIYVPVVISTMVVF